MLLCANIDDESDGVFFFFLLSDPAPPFPFADVVDVTGPGARDGPFIYIYTDVRAPLSPFFLRPLSIWISSHVHVIWDARLSLCRRRRLWMALYSLVLYRLLLPKMTAPLEGVRRRHE